MCPPPSPIIHEVPRHFCILICKSVHLSVKLKHVMDNVSPFVTNSYYFIGHILSFESSKATCVISLVCIKKILSCFVSQALNYAIQLFSNIELHRLKANLTNVQADELDRFVSLVDSII